MQPAAEFSGVLHQKIRLNVLLATFRPHFHQFKASLRLYVFGERKDDKDANISNRIPRPTLIGRSELGSWLVFGRDGGRSFAWAMVVQHRSGCAFL